MKAEPKLTIDILDDGTYAVHDHREPPWMTYHCRTVAQAALCVDNLLSGVDPTSTKYDGPTMRKLQKRGG